MDWDTVKKKAKPGRQTATPPQSPQSKPDLSEVTKAFKKKKHKKLFGLI
jgi:hypothetical protein